MTILATAQFLLAHVPSIGAAFKHNGGVTLEQRGGSWTRLGPYNIFNGNSSRYWGEAGTLASEEAVIGFLRAAEIKVGYPTLARTSATLGRVGYLRR